MNRIIIIISLFFPFVVASQTVWTLDDCIKYALKNNISIKQSEIDLQATEIDKLQTLGAFLPSLNSSVSYNLNQGKNINPVTNQYENTFFQSASGGVSMDITLFAGLQNWRRTKLLEISKLSAQYNLEKMKDDIVLVLLNSYLEVLSTKEQLKKMKAQLVISNENFQRTRDMIAVGTLPKGDIYEAESQILTQEQQIISTENALFIAKMGLAQLLLLQDYQNFDIDEANLTFSQTDILEKTPFEIFQKSTENLKELKIAQNNVLLAENNLKLAQSAYFPRLSGQWGYNSRWSKNLAEDFWTQLDSNKGMYAGLSLSVPILNGFSTLSNVKRQKINLQKAIWNEQQTKLNLQRTVYQAYTDASNAKKLFEATQKTQQAKEQAFWYATERHNVGLMTTFDFNQAKNQFQDAENEAVKAKYQYIFKLKVLQYYFEGNTFL